MLWIKYHVASRKIVGMLKLLTHFHLFVFRKLPPREWNLNLPVRVDICKVIFFSPNNNGIWCWNINITLNTKFIHCIVWFVLTQTVTFFFSKIEQISDILWILWRAFMLFHYEWNSCNCNSAKVLASLQWLNVSNFWQISNLLSVSNGYSSCRFACEPSSHHPKRKKVPIVQHADSIYY